MLSVRPKEIFISYVHFIENIIRVSERDSVRLINMFVWDVNRMYDQILICTTLWLKGPTDALHKSIRSLLLNNKYLKGTIFIM